MTTAVGTAANTTTTVAEPPAASAARRAWRWVLRLTTLAVCAVVATHVAPIVQHAVTELPDEDAGLVALAVAAELVSMGAFARLQRRMLVAGGARVTTPRMVVLTYASNALCVCLPAGVVVAAGYTYRRLRAWGANTAQSAFALSAAALLSTVSFFVLGTALGVVAGGTGDAGWTLCVAALVLGSALVARRHRDSVRAVGGRVVARVDRWRPGLIRGFVTDLRSVRPRTQDWVIGGGLAVLNRVADLTCFVLCCEAAGFPLTPTATLAAYVAGIGASSLSVIPGGLGVTDAAMIALLAAHGPVATATAAVLTYRLVSFVLVAAVGWLAWFVLWTAQRRPQLVPRLTAAMPWSGTSAAGSTLSPAVRADRTT